MAQNPDRTKGPKKVVGTNLGGYLRIAVNLRTVNRIVEEAANRLHQQASCLAFVVRKDVGVWQHLAALHAPEKEGADIRLGILLTV